MKKQKLTLNQLKVKSFVIDFENGEELTVKGGGGSLNGIVCTRMPGCGPLPTGGTPTCPDDN